MRSVVAVGMLLLASACARARTTDTTRAIALTDIASLPRIGITLPRMIDGRPDIDAPVLYALVGGGLATGLVAHVTIGSAELVHRPDCAGALRDVDGLTSCAETDHEWVFATRVHGDDTVACLVGWDTDGPLDAAQTQTVAELRAACGTLVFDP